MKLIAAFFFSREPPLIKKKKYPKISAWKRGEKPSHLLTAISLVHTKRVGYP